MRTFAVWRSLPVREDERGEGLRNRQPRRYAPFWRDCCPTSGPSMAEADRWRDDVPPPRRTFLRDGEGEGRPRYRPGGSLTD